MKGAHILQFPERGGTGSGAVAVWRRRGIYVDLPETHQAEGASSGQSSAWKKSMPKTTACSITICCNPESAFCPALVLYFLYFLQLLRTSGTMGSYPKC